MYKYKTVYDLTKNQFEELKSTYFYQLLDDGDVLNEICYPEQLPDDIIYNHYEGINFTDDDFYCSCGDNLENTHAF